MAEELKKGVLGFPSLLATAAGVFVASTTLVSLGQGVGVGGYGFIAAMVIACLLMVIQAITFSELSLMMPRAGSVSSYTEIALGHFPAIVATISGYIIIQLLAAPAELSVAGIILNQLFFPGVSPTVIALILLAIFMVLNLLGVDVFANFQVAFTVIVIATLCFVGIAGFVGHPGGTEPIKIASVGADNVFSLVALAVWLFIGVEFVCPMIEEARNPRRHVPLAMIGGLAMILVIQGLHAFVAARYVDAAKLAESPKPQLEIALAVLGKAGYYWIGAMSFFATGSIINVLLAGVPRMLYGMAHAGQVPAIFKYVHPRFKTPWVGIILLAAGMGVQTAIGITGASTIVALIVASSFAWLLAYIIVHIDVIVLRFKYPDLARPFRSPVFPVLQLLGIAGILYVMFNIFPDPVIKMQSYRYALYFLGGTAVYALLWCKFKMKKPLFKPEPYDEALKE
jgi:amino acid transporter